VAARLPLAVPGTNQITIHTSATEADLVRAFRQAFFTPPSITDHFKPTPAAHFRAVFKWDGSVPDADYHAPPGAPPGWPFG
jgi:hypothetical protein